MEEQRLAKLKKLQMTELNMLKVIVEICENHGINYYISGGTYLGSVRHKGFIPWDDDVDLAMPRKDYNEFIKIAPLLLPEKYGLSHYSIDGTYRYQAQVFDRTKKIRLKNSKKYKDVNVFVDVFPLDGMPNNPIIRWFHKINLMFKRLLYQYSVIEIHTSLNRPNRPWYESVAIYIGLHCRVVKMLNPQVRMKKMDKVLSRYDFYNSDFIFNFAGRYKFKSIMNRKEIYADGRLYDFEGLKLNGPYDYNKYLTQIYGDYMILPPEDQRNWHGSEILEDML